MIIQEGYVYFGFHKSEYDADEIIKFVKERTVHWTDDNDYFYCFVYKEYINDICKRFEIVDSDDKIVQVKE